MYICITVLLDQYIIEPGVMPGGVAYNKEDLNLMMQVITTTRNRTCHVFHRTSVWNL